LTGVLPVATQMLCHIRCANGVGSIANCFLIRELPGPIDA
jgi:hypothetical protein